MTTERATLAQRARSARARRRSRALLDARTASRRSARRPRCCPRRVRAGGKLLAVRQRRQRGRRDAHRGRVRRPLPRRRGARCRRSRSPTTPSAVTAIGNDYGYERVFARQVEALGAPGDVALGDLDQRALAERARGRCAAARARGLADDRRSRAPTAARCATRSTSASRCPSDATPRDPGGPHRRRPHPVRAGRARHRAERGLPRPRRRHQPQGARGRVRDVLGRVRVPAGRARRACALLADARRADRRRDEPARHRARPL